MRISREVRWMLVPVAAIAGFAAGFIVVSLGGTVLRLVLSEQELESTLRLDVRVGLLGAAAAFGTVVAGSAMAPSARRVTSSIILGLGGSAAWFLLRSWSFPESHPMAYQPSSVPLILTCLGGAIGTALVILIVGQETQARWRTTHGLCPQCGYDLRETPDRCPECGLRSDTQQRGRGITRRL
jgi:hypothetical protein